MGGGGAGASLAQAEKLAALAIGQRLQHAMTGSPTSQAASHAAVVHLAGLRCNSSQAGLCASVNPFVLVVDTKLQPPSHHGTPRSKVQRLPRVRRPLCSHSGGRSHKGSSRCRSGASRLCKSMTSGVDRFVTPPSKLPDTPGTRHRAEDLPRRRVDCSPSSSPSGLRIRPWREKVSPLSPPSPLSSGVSGGPRTRMPHLNYQAKPPRYSDFTGD